MNDRRGHASVPVAAPLLAGLCLVLAAAACQPAATAAPSVAAPTVVPTIAVTPEPSAAPTAAPVTPEPTPMATTAADVPCTASDLKASHGITDGAAGSLFTEVVLVAAMHCSVDAFPAFGLRDSGGNALIGGTSGGEGRITLDPGASYTTNVRLSNWCADEPTFPLELELVIAGAEVAVSGGSFPEDGVPPCNGEGGPILEASAWAPQP